MQRTALTAAMMIALSQVVKASNELGGVYIEGTDTGQGFTIERLGECYFVAPYHVVNNDIFLGLVGSDDFRSHAEGYPLQSFGYDLMTGHLTGALKDHCGPTFDDIPTESSLIENSKNAVVSTVNPDGLISRTPVTISETGLIYLSIVPAQREFNLFQGMSGSLVYVENVAIGMLQSIDQTTGAGQVLRMDRLTETIRPFFATSRQSALEATPVASQNQTAIPYSIDYWSERPIRDQDSIATISDHDISTTYTTSLYGDSFEIRFTPTDQNINKVMLVLPEDHGVKDIEIRTSRRDSGRRGWISLTTQTVMPSEREVSFDINTVARRVQLIIHSSWNENEMVSVSELSLH